jgi:regulator of cell morphogenesis and NO signaling
MTITIDQSLGDLVTRSPGAARIFERAGLDYCCKGRRTLADACSAAGLDAEAIAEELAVMDADAEADDWSTLPPRQLIEHIVSSHHRYLREELPRLVALADRVEAAHGARHSELVEVAALVRALQADLAPHLDKEEKVLFPAMRTLLDGGPGDFPFGSIDNPLRVMATDHDHVGELLETLRRTTADYAVPDDGCASYRALYEGLVALEHDTHVHVHKENNVLFPAFVQSG